ncbi:MAG: glycosyltransferase family 39 protein [Deltaproteobacteria bacterium]|jgi:4-amino-4-deoxy-L-arabinose transferase-like glycosyltransferase|nr:glycosyltransferase family 39 protein [Deltaproteobacteria bacterium]
MGKLYASLPLNKEFFDYAHIINDNKWYSQYPPGHSLLLMLGLFVGAPWLIGPLLGTLSLFIFYLLVKNIYGDHQITYLSSTLLLLSPFFLFMSSNHMNHTSTLFFIVLFLYFYTRIFSSDSLTPAFFSGLSLGYAINIRPLTAVAIGIPFICNLLVCAYKKREVKMRKVLIFAVAVSLMVILLLLYNYLTNGNPLLFGYQEKYYTLGFLGDAQGWQPQPHTLKGGIINTSNNLIGLNQYLFEWPLPSLIFILILFSTSIRKNRWDYLFLLSSLTLILGYFFYYHQDYIFGPRFYYSLTPFLIILTARGFLGIPHWLEKKRFNKRKIEASLYLLLLLCFLYTLSFSLPSLVKKYSDDYWWVTDKLHKTVKEQGITNAIVFIDCWHPPKIKKPNLIYYGSGFQLNSPDLKDDVIYALDLKDKNIELMKAFPNRDYYFCSFFWDRDTVAW